MNDEELERLKDKIYMFERLSVCVEPGTPKTPLRDGVVLPVIETSSSRKRGGGGAASSVAPRKGVVGGSKTASGWTYLPASTEGYAELSDAIFEMYLHPSFVRDPQRQEPQLVVPHAIADMKRSEDGFCLIVNSISSDCMNKRRVATSPEHSQHSRSRVYFVITRSREVAESSGIPDAYISQRCHCQKSYGGVSCKSYKSPRRQLPAEVVALLWPPTQQHTLSLQVSVPTSGRYTNTGRTAASQGSRGRGGRRHCGRLRGGREGVGGKASPQQASRRRGCEAHHGPACT